MASGTIKHRGIVQIYSSLNIPTTATSVSCNWSDYEALVFDVQRYSNHLASIVVDKTWFNSTNSNARVFLINPRDTTLFYEIWKNGADTIYVSASSENSTYGIKIYGINF